MADQVELDIRVTSNVDRLSEHAIHRLYADLLTSTVEDTEEFLRFIVPKDTDRMAEHVGHHPAHETGAGLAAAVGIPRIEGAGGGVSPAVKDLFAPGEQDSEDYPLFVDRGTGIFGPAGVPIHARKVHVMHFEDQGGHDIFREEVKGQPGAHFMLASYAFARIALLAHVRDFEEHVKHLATPGGNL